LQDFWAILKKIRNGSGQNEAEPEDIKKLMDIYGSITWTCFYIQKIFVCIAVFSLLASIFFTATSSFNQ
jgi:hypothetical protein